MSLRKLPVYLVLDCSESMAGDAIQSVARGLDTLLAHLRSDPRALESVFLSSILFSKDAEQDQPLTELLTFRKPVLRVRPGTAFGGALRVLRESIDREVVRSTVDVKGDYKPLVFLLTDGQPTDEWEDAAAAVRSARGHQLAELYAIGCGPDIDPEVLFRVTDAVYLMENFTPEAISRLFIWLSSSVKSASKKIGSGDPAAAELPQLPEGIVRAAPSLSSETPASKTSVSQVFLHARCSRTRKPYLMRYKKQQYLESYEPVASHRLENFEEGDESAIPPINSSMLNGAPACPYCENESFGMCPCGALFCMSDKDSAAVICPKCELRLSFTAEAREDFDVRRSQG